MRVDHRDYREAEARSYIYSVRHELKELGLWYGGIIVSGFRYGRTWIHADETHIHFPSLSICSDSSLSGSAYHRNSFALKATNLPVNIRKHWLTKDSTIGDFKALFATCDSHNRCMNDARSKVLFVNQLKWCPICQSARIGDLEEWRADSIYTYYYPFDVLIETTKRLLSGPSFNEGMKVARCYPCSGKSFKDKWRTAFTNSKGCLRESGNASEILKLWPEFDMPDSQEHIVSRIVRHLKKVTRVRPLSKGEINFFRAYMSIKSIEQIWKH